eukprot:jgi/Ulvmu1/6427/UM003_0056.1
MADAPGPTISLRPGGGRRNNPFATFSQGAGVKAAVPQKVVTISGTPHSTTVDEKKKELGVDLLKYSKEFMNQFAERNTRAPAGLEAVKGLVIDDVTSKTIGTAGPKPAEKENDSWRSSAAPAAGGGDNMSAAREGGAAARAAAAAAAANPRGPPPPEASIIQKAEDIGRQKWAPAKDLTSTAQAQQKLRGLLNKLTPDNFDRLTPQVLSIMAASPEVLRASIPLLFEKAVAEPTFCALYADLSSVLSASLADHDFGTESGKPVAFRRELLNACQDEFEGMQLQREKVAADAGGDPAELEYARRKLKMRQLGTLRLIAELFNRDLLTHSVMRIVMMDMLDRCRTSGGAYDVPLIECLVQALTIAGEKMSKTEKIAKSLDKVVKTLGQWSNDSNLEARIRFKIKDLQDQIAAGWRARHGNTVKKTEEIRREAQTELGIVQPQLPSFLPTLNLGPVVPKPDTQTQQALFPAEELYGMPIPESMKGDALRPDAADAAKDTSAPRGALPDADVRKKAHGTFQEFLSIRDLKEAEQCLREMLLDARQEALVVETAMNDTYDLQKEEERASMRAVITHLAAEGYLSGDAIVQGLKAHTDFLEDIAVDIPLAPQILGKFIAGMLERQQIAPTAFEVLFAALGAADAKRSIFKFAMKDLIASLGQSATEELMAPAKGMIGPLLQGDPELDAGLPTVFDFVKMEGLQWAIA